MALNFNPEIALRLRKSRHRLASATPIVRRDKNSDDEKLDERLVAPDIAEDLDQLLDDSILRQNQRAIAAHLDDGYYVKSLTPGLFVPFATAAHGTAGQSAGLGKWPTIDYPDAAASYAVAAFRRPAMWVSGKLSVSIYYTSTAAGTANFSILLHVIAVPKNGNLSNTGVTVLYTAPIVAAGPVAIDDEQMVEAYTTTSFSPSTHRIGIRIGRDGVGDANNNLLQITEVVVKHIPAAQEVTVR